MRKIFILLGLALGATAFVSCSEDYDIQAPNIKGFTYQPKQVHPGDTVRITLEMKDHGKYLYSPRYTWNLSTDTIDAQGYSGIHYTKYEKQGSVEDKSPALRYVVPQTAAPGGMVKCTLSIEYTNAVDATGTERLNTVAQDGYLGQFNVSLGTGVLTSSVGGTFSFRLAQ